MISEFIQQIVSLDHKTEETVAQTQAEAEKIQKQTGEQIRSAQQKVSADAKQSGQQALDKATAEAEQKRDSIMKASDAECSNIEASYEKIKMNTAKHVIEALLAE